MKESKFIPTRKTFMGGHTYKAPRYDVSVIEAVLADIYTILKNHNNIIHLINEIRKNCKVIEGDVTRITGAGLLAGLSQLHFDSHNRIVDEISQVIDSNCQACIELIDNFLVN